MVHDAQSMVTEHLQEFAKINLANLVIWQLAKIYAKSKIRLSPRVCHLGLVKLKIRPTYAQLLGPDQLLPLRPVA